jgi:hypothetical protein
VPIYNIEVIGNIAYLVQPGQIGAIPLANVEEDVGTNLGQDR